MARSPTERVTALERTVDTHATQLDTFDKRVDAVYNAHSETAKELAILKRDFDREFALLKREVEELRKWQDDIKKGKKEWGRKLWMILPPVLAVLISNALTFIITLYLKK
jgi:hypothetical protein